MTVSAVTSDRAASQIRSSDLTGLTISEVVTKSDEATFLHVHVVCNCDSPSWIRPLDNDIRQVFDRSRNKFFHFGDAVRWIVFDKQGKAVGRVAAFVNRKYKNKGDRFPVGGIGFFDAINNQDVANHLFDTARKWLEARGVKAMDGPINFGERDRWWGLLVEGFDPPLYGMNFNPPYYKELFETYGFRNFYNQICWRLPVAGLDQQLSHKFYEAHARFANNPEFEARYIPVNEFGKCIAYFCKVYNKAWAKHEGNKEISMEQATRLLQSIRPVLDPYLIWFVFHKGEPVAMWISIPDVNQIMKRLNGKFGWWEKLRFIYYKMRGTCTRFVGIIYGIVPELQGTGVDYFMIVEAEKVIKSKTRYRQTELLWQGDFNPRMLNISRNLGAEQCRRLVTYRYIFDPSIPFSRHPEIH